MISQKAKYALRALVALCRNADAADPLMISEISRTQAIPKKFLEQILLELKRHGIVMSRRGRLGGYVLLRAREKVTFGEVLRSIDGPIAPMPCSATLPRRCVVVRRRDLRDPSCLRSRCRGDAGGAGPDDAGRRCQQPGPGAIAASPRGRARAPATQ